ncbi:polyketide cyclase [Dietzia sp. HMSC21D01]|uniref:SRPBCC family protein n=1 Tax=Dietzia cinnamea TaxID=321318 RepID=A0AAW5Q5M1_9ACTN|nr:MULTISPECIES: SRPBCC family protein [Dietzia]KZO59949.1 polyketide cyclase [Dietzia maris]MCT1640123.1 SRPBCC family protein [Dietzia cinnamea]MCT1864355.1 SRPBCC family protein [Dietzia cinnamea]MCT1883598.1 SRPBCC family protein [Dietzia cinnamea]MCT2030480.1 SRPBCC family protein [Dietzia cinnamea]
MARVTATNTIVIEAPVDAVTTAIADYARVRPRIQPEQFSAYRLIEGGQGHGTVAAWNLQATKKRNRDVKATVTVDDAGAHWSLVEKDENSSMATTYTVREATGGSLVEMTTSWNGAGGVGGFFERTFAPAGLKRIQHQLLTNLKADVEG